MAFELTRIQASEVDNHLAAELEAIALDSWAQGFQATRYRDEIAEKFNPSDPGHVARAADMYRTYAKDGVLMIATDARSQDKEKVGFALVINDVSPSDDSARSVVERTFKRVESVVLFPSKSRIYTKLGLLVVSPDRRYEGAGTELLHGALLPYRRRGSRGSTAYIYEENPYQQWFIDRGYRKPSDKPEPVKAFGPDNPPVAQHRFTGKISEILAVTARKMVESA